MAVKYTEDHEWVLVEGDTATVGITEYAQNALGDIVFVETPEVGRAVDKGEDCAVVESVKTASDIYAPITGEITEGNEALEDAPELVNSSPEGDGWFFKMTIGDASELDELLDEAAYKKFCEDLD
ncbi:glycine cleavage complex lipoylprotein [Candidatus Terasakiella magnetica]|uniref:Glycine cleavage system H protein n=1 Tax=Candidatus Terasakiella magnetica TaxID=1867952 RepID=A0A1C3RE56_9PROT|nr:glycine cleavage system protein GcvH [Candidatus Terasakiella magnetica]SCA55580.1 glycine cleavage complex lipoylprotein [Candidatus Terasakiella magnetica]